MNTIRILLLSTAAVAMAHAATLPVAVPFAPGCSTDWSCGTMYGQPRNLPADWRDDAPAYGPGGEDNEAEAAVDITRPFRRT